MKKIIFLSVMVILVSSCTTAKDETLTLLNGYIDWLGGSPLVGWKDFVRLQEYDDFSTLYHNPKDGTLLITDRYSVPTRVTCGNSYNTETQAISSRNGYINYFKKHGWEYVGRRGDGDAFTRHGGYSALVHNITKKSDVYFLTVIVTKPNPSTNYNPWILQH